MAGRLAPVPEESADCSTAAYPPRSQLYYRDSIRQVKVSRRQIRATLSSHSQSDHSGSTDSGTSNSYPSNNSGCSSGTAQSTAVAADFGTNELVTIACRMVSDGYAQRMVQAYHVASLAAGTPSSLEYGDGRVSVLESWFFELDVAWVLQIRQDHAGSQGQLRLQDKSDSSLQDLVQRWIRGLTVIVSTVVELVTTRHETGAVARFGEASISKMVVFVDAITPVLKAEHLPTVLDMHICVSRESDNMRYYEEFLGLEFHVLPTLYMSVNKLNKAISIAMEKLTTLIEDEGPWHIEILRGGGGEIHRSTRWIADCIVSLREAEANSFFVRDNDPRPGMRYHMIVYLKHLLLRKSELCSDPSLRYLFLLNNSYFAAQMIGPRDPKHDWKLPLFKENDWKLSLQCQEYMDSYLDVSWGPVLSCIPKSHFSGPLHRWINTSSLGKFESAFNKTYKAQKFWKVPDPQLRDELRRAITDRVVSSYCDYLKEHPELAEHVSRRNSTPEVMEEMLGQLFEG